MCVHEWCSFDQYRHFWRVTVIPISFLKTNNSIQGERQQTAKSKNSLNHDASLWWSNDPGDKVKILSEVQKRNKIHTRDQELEDRWNFRTAGLEGRRRQEVTSQILRESYTPVTSRAYMLSEHRSCSEDVTFLRKLSQGILSQNKQTNKQSKLRKKDFDLGAEKNGFRCMVHLLFFIYSETSAQGMVPPTFS